MTSCTYAANAGVASAPDICASRSMAESQCGNLSRLDATQATSWERPERTGMPCAAKSAPAIKPPSINTIAFSPAGGSQPTPKAT